MTAPKNSFWTPFRTAVVMDEYPTGKSSGAIAEGLGCTRNMVIGKARRLGLTTPVVKSAITDKPVVHRSAPFTPPRPDKPQVAPVVSSKAPPSVWKALDDLEAQDCRWIVAEGPFLFCAAQVEDTYSWCPHHCGRAFTANSYRPVQIPGSGR